MPRPRTFEALGEATRTRDEHIKHVAELESSIHRYNALVEEDTQRHLAHRQTFPKTPFTPDPTLTSTLLYELNSDANLLYTADKYKVPIEELCLWMNQPEVSIRLKAIQSSMAFKLNSSIISRSQQAVTSMARIFDSFNELESDLSLLSGNEISTKNALRNREGLTKAATTLARLKREVADGFPLGPSDQSRAAQAAGPASTNASSAPNTPDVPPTPGMSEGPGGAERIPGSTVAPQPPKPTTTPPTPLPLCDLKSQIRDSLPPTPTTPPSPEPPVSNLKFQTCNSASPPTPAVHPDAHRYPDGPALQRDPLPANHPAVITGAAPSLTPPTASAPAPASTSRCASSSTCHTPCPSKSAPNTHPP